jgi:hypothetical protein
MNKLFHISGSNVLEGRGKQNEELQKMKRTYVPAEVTNSSSRKCGFRILNLISWMTFFLVAWLLLFLIGESNLR